MFPYFILRRANGEAIQRYSILDLAILFYSLGAIATFFADKNSELNWNLISSPLVEIQTKLAEGDILNVFLEVATLGVIVWAFVKLILLVCLIFKIGFLRLMTTPSFLYFKKLRDELLSIKLNSRSAFSEFLNQGVENDLFLTSFGKKKFVGRQEVGQQKIYTSDWTFWRREIHLFSLIGDFSRARSQFHKNREDNLNELRKLLPEVSRNEIEFFVAHIQPSIVWAAREVINTLGAETKVKLISETTNGPDTTTEALRSALSDNSKGVLFAAPLATYSMFESTEASLADVDPTEYFVPVMSVLHEVQEVLFVEDYKRSPVRRKNRIYFYGNSTAEECIAKTLNEIDNVYETVQVEDFSNYIKLIYGIETSMGSLIPGDGIALWDPLITKYLGKRVGEGVLSRSVQVTTFKNKSMICLFADVGVVDLEYPGREFYLRFLKAVMYEARYLKLNLGFKKWNSLPLLSLALASRSLRKDYHRDFGKF